ncbi:MAG: hypothetical protein ABII79_06440 [bacterium]
MSNTEIHSPSQDHNITATDHWQRCRKLLDEPRDSSDFFYAALELRCCIERVCFECLVLLTHRTRDLSKSELKLYKPKELFQAVFREAPHYAKLVDFINTVFEVGGYHYPVVIPDFVWLQETHGKLGRYLHAQKEELSVKDKIEAKHFLNHSLEQIFKYLRRANISEWWEHSKSIFDKYVEGSIDRGQMRRMLELANIPHHMINKP